MSNVILCYRNILENSGGIVTVTSENASFPKYRLYDRDIGKLFKGTTTPANFYITLDQGGTIYEVDRLLIPLGHNLDGLLLKLQYSTDNFAGDVNDAASWTQSDSGLINKTFTAQTKRYWRLNIAAPASIPILAEMYLTKTYTFVQNVAFDLQEKKQRNIGRRYTGSGNPRISKYGESKQYRNYRINCFLAAQKTEFESWETLCEGIKPVYISDHNGSWMFVEILNEISFSPLSNDLWSIGLELLETTTGGVGIYLLTEEGERIIIEDGTI